jgi:hypothetical protein
LLHFFIIFYSLGECWAFLLCFTFASLDLGHIDYDDDDGDDDHDDEKGQGDDTTYLLFGLDDLLCE